MPCRGNVPGTIAPRRRDSRILAAGTVEAQFLVRAETWPRFYARAPGGADTAPSGPSAHARVLPRDTATSVHRGLAPDGVLICAGARRAGTAPSSPRGAAAAACPSSPRRSPHEAHPRPDPARGVASDGSARPPPAAPLRRDGQTPRQRQDPRYGLPRARGRAPARATTGGEQVHVTKADGAAPLGRRPPPCWPRGARPSSPPSATEGAARRAVCSTPSPSRNRGSPPSPS